MANLSDGSKLQSVDQWGDIQWMSMEYAFYNATNVQILATDTPNLSRVTSMNSMFHNATNLTGNFSGWDTSKVADMSYMFYNATNFNQDIGNWNIEKVTSMRSMLTNTSLSIYNYNAILDGRSKQNPTTSPSIGTIATPYGGCESNASAGIQGHIILASQGWSFSDGGKDQSCEVIGQPFITQWITTVTNEEITIQTTRGGYDFTIDWGDGTTGAYSGSPGPIGHIYEIPSSGHLIQIRGDFPRILMDTNSRSKLLSINQWGDILWTNMEQAFYGAANLQILATDTPNLSRVKSMSQMFLGATNLTGNFSGWDASSVTNMSQMFQAATNFN
jgi:surface protein